MNDKTILIVALGVGAFLLTRPVRAQPVGTGTTAAQRAFAAGNQGPTMPNLYAQAGGLLAGLLGNIGGGGGASLTNGEYSGLVNNPYVKADAQAVFGNGNVFDSAAAAITKNPFGLYSSDGAAANPAPGFSSVYDYSKEYWY